MGGPPAAVIVVRHGSRLDAADKQWHLNSPTPYDPPLTYGGWTQCRSLGIRIASLLAELPPSHPSVEGQLNEQPKRKRKQRVVIHSSPFLRCIQTSIALASGLAATPTVPNATEQQLSLARRAATMPQFSHSAARSSSRNRLDSPMLAPLPEALSPVISQASTFPDSNSAAAHKDGHPPAVPIQKAILRVDAFLGEWLSPDYFEKITPPPSSVMMVAAAKADLLRREDYGHLSSSGVGAATILPPSSGFPGGWGSPSIPTRAHTLAEQATADAEDDLPGPALSLPIRDRTSSMSSVGSSSSSRLSGHPTMRPTSSSNHPLSAGIYHPPTPHYAISNSDPIPPGHVAHSKDACVDADYQWDSMREPQNWGDGGEYGEEWGSMHKRFRRGLKAMVDWYRTHDAQIHRTSSRPSSRPGSGYGSGSGSWESHQIAEDEEEEEDLVVILVTHGAGCNALIGALTNQPALLDVGMANLTMAVRKPLHIPPTTYLRPSTAANSPSITPKPTPRPTPIHSRSSSRILNLSDEYELKLLNSSEHLRRSSAASNASFTGNLPNLPFRPFFSRPSTVTSGGSDTSTTPFVEPGHLSRGSSPGDTGRASYGGVGAISDLLPSSSGLRRTVSVASGSGSSAGGRTYTPRFKGSVGLWSPRRGSGHENEEEGTGEEDTRGDDMVLNFAEEREARESQPVTPAPSTPSTAVVTDPMAKAAGGSAVPKTANGDGSADSDVEGALETVSPSQGGGLWGAPHRPEAAGLKPLREMGLKRRWTVTEKGKVGEGGLDRV